jgi:hypothetical protein
VRAVIRDPSVGGPGGVRWAPRFFTFIAIKSRLTNGLDNEYVRYLKVWYWLYDRRAGAGALFVLCPHAPIPCLTLFAVLSKVGKGVA